MNGWQWAFPYPVPCRTARQPSAQISERRPVPDGYDIWVSILLCVLFRERGPHLSDTLLFQPAILSIKQGRMMFHRIKWQSSLKQMPRKENTDHCWLNALLRSLRPAQGIIVSAAHISSYTPGGLRCINSSSAFPPSPRPGLCGVY
jgi:hypothetical protein